MSSFGLRTPCAKCPFRTDIKPYLTRARIKEILMTHGTFDCHETIDYDNVDGDGETSSDQPNAQVCAGWLICLEHDGIATQMMRIAERIGLYDRRRLRMNAPVYRGILEAMKAHPKRR